MADAVLLEVCVDSLESAQRAVANGADRLEICGCLGVGGGLTPSFGLVTAIREACPTTPLHVMIRPRLGGFCYAKDELAVMHQDIALFKKHIDIQGFVFGTLTQNGKVDISNLASLVDISLPKSVTFHRAFDVTPDTDEALEDIASVPGVARILTSGGALKAPNALDVLSRLSARAQAISLSRNVTTLETTGTMYTNQSLTILPGSGLNSRTLPAVLDALYPPPSNSREVHCSCGSWVVTMTNDEWTRGLPFKFGAGGPGEHAVWRTDSDEVARVAKILNHGLGKD